MAVTEATNKTLQRIPTNGIGTCSRGAMRFSFMTHWFYGIIGFPDPSGLPAPVAELVRCA